MAESKNLEILSLGDFKIEKIKSKIGSVEISFPVVIYRRNFLAFGNEFASGLGFTNPRKAFVDHIIDSEDITTVEDVFGKDFRLTLKQYFHDRNDSLRSDFFQNLRPKSKLLSKHAIYALCLGSKLPEIKSFRRWIYDLIDKVLETGTYNISDDMQQLSIEETPVEKIESTFKFIPSFVFGGDNTERKEMSSTFKKGKELSKHLGKSRGGTIGGTERDRRDKSRIELLVEIYNSESLQDENLRKKLEEIVIEHELLAIDFG